MKYSLCLDIGASKLAGGLINKPPKILNYKTTKTLAKKPSQIILENLINFIKLIKNNKKLKSINLAVAGQIDIKKGLIIQSPNFNKNFKNIKIKKLLEAEFKLPVYIDNDVNCFALGEAVYGLGKKYQNIIGLTLGSGVGGGIIINKKLYRGKNNLAGEFGHCFIKNKIWEKNKTNIKNINYLNQALFNILHSFDPDAIIIGGGISKNKNFIKQARQNLNKLLYYQSIKTTPILKSKLQEKANLLGAYSLKSNQNAKTSF